MLVGVDGECACTIHIGSVHAAPGRRTGLCDVRGVKFGEVRWRWSKLWVFAVGCGVECERAGVTRVGPAQRVL